MDKRLVEIVNLKCWLGQVSPIPRLGKNWILIIGIGYVDPDECVTVQRRIALILSNSKS